MRNLIAKRKRFPFLALSLLQTTPPAPKESFGLVPAKAERRTPQRPTSRIRSTSLSTRDVVDRRRKSPNPLYRDRAFCLPNSMMTIKISSQRILRTDLDEITLATTCRDRVYDSASRRLVERSRRSNLFTTPLL